MIDYETLNGPQKEGVMAANGPVLLLAGAGSGKTRVLTYRTAHLINDLGVAPYNILAITFTNKAAGEMKERIENILGGEQQGVWVSTFHSFCIRMLRLFRKDIGYDTDFVIYDADDQKTLMKDIMKRLDLDPKTYKEKTFLNIISHAKDNLITPNQYAMDAGSDYMSKLQAQIYSEYQSQLKKNNAMDFDDLIMKMVFLLRESDNALDYVNDRFKYIMVDEYQDTNVAQFELVRLLAGKNRNLCVVGDDDQSIYKFRGANIYNILNFEKYFPDAKVIKLEENYRSTGNILAAANAVIKNNKGRKEKKLWTQKDAGEEITLKVLDNGYEEAEYIVDTIVRAHRKGDDFNKNAVLYRTNAQSRTLEEKFVNAGVPYKIVGGVNFYSRREIKDVLAYLRCINNSSDDISVKRILNVPKRGIGQTSINKVSQYAEFGDMSFYDALCEADDIPTLGAAAKKIKGFVNLIRIIRAFEDELSVHELIQKLLEESGYLEELKAEDKLEQTDRAENVEELVNKAADFDEQNPEGTLGEFLQEVALVAEIDSLDENQDYVVLMTLHGAKGLEFPRVFLAGMEDGLFPSFMSITSDNSNEELEEERRLCYVGITRAMEKLYITSARTRMVRGEIQYGKLSRFVEEIPKELFGGDNPENVKKERPVPNYTPRNSVYTKNYSGGGLSAADFLKATGKSSATAPSRASSLSSVATKGAPVGGKPDYVVGDRVRHIKFGDGTVLSLNNAGRDYEVSVQFDSAGIKKMFAGFAKLQKI